jgi:hypothetical protein
MEYGREEIGNVLNPVSCSSHVGVNVECGVVTSFQKRLPHKKHEPHADGEIAQSPLENVLNVLRVEEETTTTAGAMWVTVGK